MRVDRHAVFEFMRYFAGSAAALLVDYGVLFTAVSLLGFNYLLGTALGFVAGTAVVYLLSIRWVFRQRTCADATRELLLFALVGVLGLALNLGIMWLLVGLLSVYYLWSKLVAVVLSFLFNFGLRKRWLF